MEKFDCEREKVFIFLFQELLEWEVYYFLGEKWEKFLKVF